jgi:DNA-binding transcriptional MerR regulator
MSASEPRIRIGALSRRVGVAPELLRAWEQRYGLLRPHRSPGGYRLYSRADEERIRAMLRHIASGISAAEAAGLALARPEVEQPDDASSPALERLGRDLRSALDRFDDPAGQMALDRLLGVFTLEAVLRDVVVPYLRELGERWERGHATIAQEHFASNLLRGRLLGLARGWGSGAGPRAVLACAPGELHDLALIAFGLVLGARGWRITYLGPDTPVATVQEARAEIEPARVVIAAVTDERLLPVQRELRRLGRHGSLALAGAGATADLALATGAALLEGDPVSAAESVAAGGS